MGVCRVLVGMRLVARAGGEDRGEGGGEEGSRESCDRKVRPWSETSVRPHVEDPSRPCHPSTLPVSFEHERSFRPCHVQNSAQYYLIAL